jgi:hypothetical protein
VLHVRPEEVDDADEAARPRDRHLLLRFREAAVAAELEEHRLDL